VGSLRDDERATLDGARGRDGVVMTDSAKWAYYAPGNLGVDVAFGTLADCVESAVLGDVLCEPLT
jgi:predicted aconitase